MRSIVLEALALGGHVEFGSPGCLYWWCPKGHPNEARIKALADESDKSAGGGNGAVLRHIDKIKGAL